MKLHATIPGHLKPRIYDFSVRSIRGVRFNLLAHFGKHGLETSSGMLPRPPQAGLHGRSLQSWFLTDVSDRNHLIFLERGLFAVFLQSDFAVESCPLMYTSCILCCGWSCSLPDGFSSALPFLLTYVLCILSSMIPEFYLICSSSLLFLFFVWYSWFVWFAICFYLLFNENIDKHFDKRRCWLVSRLRMPLLARC